MLITDYYSGDSSEFQFSRQQSSDFAKRIADDFNPLHNQDAKLFCVPGDLLFALTLAEHGLSEQMHFSFTGMVGDGIPLHFTQVADNRRQLVDRGDKVYLDVQHSGELNQQEKLISDFCQAYVRFSGHNFERALVPLMIEHQLILNPGRPLAIYESMSFEFDRLDIKAPELEFIDATLQPKGKKADVHMHFCLKDAGEVVGRGEKKMMLRGLREFDQAEFDQLVSLYENNKQAHSS